MEWKNAVSKMKSIYSNQPSIPLLLLLVTWIQSDDQSRYSKINDNTHLHLNTKDEFSSFWISSLLKDLVLHQLLSIHE